MFWLTVLEVSVYDHLTLHYWACVKGVHLGGSLWWRNLLTSWQPESRKRNRKGLLSQYSLKGHTPQWPDWLPFTRFHLPRSQEYHRLTKPSTYYPWETFRIQAIAVRMWWTWTILSTILSWLTFMQYSTHNENICSLSAHGMLPK